MKVIEPYHKILTELNNQEIMKHLEYVGRTCYASRDLITDNSAEKFVASIVERNHLSVIEHFSLSVKFICDRAIANELVRHRIASFAQQSTRYCNYSKSRFDGEITFILPHFFEPATAAFNLWYENCRQAENTYFALLDMGYKPEECRTVLPNSLATEIVMTANLREWLHTLTLRTAKESHPQMRQLMIPLLKELQEKLPIIFKSISLQD